jgi:hypothetical protein
MILKTMPDERPEVDTWIENRVYLPRCCPVSKNPEPGSHLSLRYRVNGRVLEVFSLKAYIDSYVGGHADGTRNMETMIQKIAQECAAVLSVTVYARAFLLLRPGQEMRVSCTGRPPRDVLSRHASPDLARAVVGPVVRLPAPVGAPEVAAEGDV